jgi:ankyrin repeat protein
MPDSPSQSWNYKASEEDYEDDLLSLLTASVYSGNHTAAATLSAWHRAFDKKSWFWERVSHFNRNVQWFSAEWSMSLKCDREGTEEFIQNFNIPEAEDVTLKLAAFDALVLGYSGLDTPLHVVARRGDLTTLRRIMVVGDSNPECCRQPQFLKLEDHNGETPILATIESGQKECTEFLYSLVDQLDREERSTILERHGRLPLHYAACCKTPTAVRKLLKFDKAQKSSLVGDADGMLPLHMAAKSGTAEIVKCLLEADPSRASLYKANKDGMLPLHCAVSSYQIDRAAQTDARERVKALLKADSQGKSLYAKDHRGMLPLHHATTIDPRAGFLEVVREYLSGTNTSDIQNAVGDRCTSGNTAQLLLHADRTKKSLYLKDNDGDIPLHLALRQMALFRGSPFADETVRVLLDADKDKLG